MTYQEFKEAVIRYARGAVRHSLIRPVQLLLQSQRGIRQLAAFSAEAAQKGMSLLNGKEGEKIAADFITIVDDPSYHDSVMKRSFFISKPSYISPLSATRGMA